MLKKHEHSLITAIVVGLGVCFDLGIYALIVMAGIWLGREHNQAEMRYMKMRNINRDKLKFFDGFKKEAWNRDSFINDLVLPITVGTLILGVFIW